MEGGDGSVVFESQLDEIECLLYVTGECLDVVIDPLQMIELERGIEAGIECLDGVLEQKVSFLEAVGESLDLFVGVHPFVAAQHGLLLFVPPDASSSECVH